MKKIFVLIASILCMAGAASANCLMYHDFENITDNAETYIKNTEGIATSSTNHSIKSYDFVDENGNKKLRFTGYKTGDKPGNATRKFEFLFSEYSAEKYPDTKLVVGYDETVEASAKASYTHNIVSSGGDDCMSQLFVFPNSNAVNMKMLNTGSSAAVTYGTNTEYRMITDIANQSFVFRVGENFSDTYSFKQPADILSKIAWMVQEDDVYSIDNIYAWAVPNNFKVKRYDADVENKKVTLYLSAPAEKSALKKITVNGKSDISVTQDFETARIDIDFAKVETDNRYEINFGKDFADIAENVMTDTSVTLEKSNCLMYHDFENIADNAEVYIKNTGNILTSSTNSGIKSYDFIYSNGNKRLLFTGYKKEEMNGNASRKFEFVFSDYSTEKYPDTKLVMGYDETVDERTDNNYLHMVTADSADKKMSQLFVFVNGDTDIMRMFIKDEKRIPHGTNSKYKLIADMNTQKFVFGIGENFSKEYDFQNNLTSLSKMVWLPEKGEKYSLDNIYAYAVPNTFKVKNYDINMEEKKISLYLSAPADESVLNNITVNGSGDIKISQDFKEARIDIVLNDISYGNKYTVAFGEGFCDIAGNIISGDVETETEAFPQPNIITEKIGEKHRIYAKNSTANNVNAYIIAGLYNENGMLEECAFFAADFAPMQKHGFECEFKTSGTVKAFAAEKAVD